MIFPRKNQSAISEQYGVNLIAYEGGQHFVGHGAKQNDPSCNALLDAVNRDPRMKVAYTAYLASWKRAGGGLFMNFSSVGRYSKWGRWGVLEHLLQPRLEAPKFDALMTFIESTSSPRRDSRNVRISTATPP